jgi:hypothetical protein
MHRQIGVGWQEAVAIEHLADCERALGREDASREQFLAALMLLEPFPDPRAAALRETVQARLG